MGIRAAQHQPINNAHLTFLLFSWNQLTDGILIKQTKIEASGQPKTPSLQRKLGNIATSTMYMY